ncbi:MAG: two-component regulator propeller domain-containing protein, partial [Lysobacter spongiicola]|nr:two-component regulator propeller domain-containing protein [Lysobacter spongiicola]
MGALPSMLGMGMGMGMGVAFAGVPELPSVRHVGVAHGLPSSTVNGIVEDRDGYVWLATTDGLARHDGAEIMSWRHDPADPSALPGNVVTAVHVDPRNRIWVATEARG